MPLFDRHSIGPFLGIAAVLILILLLWRNWPDPTSSIPATATQDLPVEALAGGGAKAVSAGSKTGRTVSMRAVEFRLLGEPQGQPAMEALLQAVAKDGSYREHRVQIPGQLELSRQQDWLLLCSGPWICTQLSAIKAAPENSSGDQTLWLVPTGTAEIVLHGTIPEPKPKELPVQAALQVHGTPEWLIGPATGLILDPRLQSAHSPRTMGITDRTPWALDDLSSPVITPRKEFLQEMKDLPRSWQLASAPLQESIANAEFRLALRPGSVPTAHHLPANIAFRWRLYGTLAFQVSPVAQDHASKWTESGFSRDLSEPATRLWSGPFEIPFQGVRTLEATVYSENLVRGQLDFPAIPGPIKESRVALFKQVFHTNSEGKGVTLNQREILVRPDADGNFRASGVWPGRKRLAAVWKNSDGQVCIANRIFDIQPQGTVDLGLISPERCEPVTLDFGFYSPDTGQEFSWQELYGNDDPGEATVILTNTEKKPRPEDDFWEALYPKMGSTIEIHGLAPSKWYLTTMAEGAQSMWPQPLEQWMVDRTMDETIIDTAVRRQQSIRFEVYPRDTVYLALDLPDAALARGMDKDLFLRGISFSLPDGERNSGTMIFQDKGAGHRMEIPRRNLPMVIIVGGNKKDPRPVLGVMELTEEDFDEAGVATLEMKEGYWASVQLTDTQRSQLRTSLVQIDVAGWPSTAKPHLMTLVGEDGQFTIGPVPQGAVLTERTLGLLGTIVDGELKAAR